jgi:hypothetical protein
MNSIGLHGVISSKIKLFIVTAVRTSDPKVTHRFATMFELAFITKFSLSVLVQAKTIQSLTTAEGLSGHSVVPDGGLFILCRKRFESLQFHRDDPYMWTRAVYVFNG